VAVLDRLRALDYLRERGGEYRLTPEGEDFLRSAEIDVMRAQATRRRFAYACLDWSHRVPHLGGALGASLLDWMFRRKVVVRRKSSRAVRLTHTGQQELKRYFGISLSRSGMILGRSKA
jgi:predicted transcriptional regulator